MIVADEKAMRDFGQTLAATLKAGDWIAIDGPLGAGKTVLCAGILQGLGYAGEVASPSYAIVHQYDPPELSVAVAHVDLYRLEHVGELDELGLAEERAGRITLVEWAERSGQAYAPPTHHIRIEPQASGERELTVKTENNDADS